MRVHQRKNKAQGAANRNNGSTGTATFMPPPFKLTGADQEFTAPPTTIQKQEADEVTKYTVVSGDTLSRIAKKHNTTVAAIVELNKLTDANSLKVGQVLKIQSGSKTTSKTAEKDTAEATLKSVDELDKQHSDPMQNSNTAYQNLVLLIAAWQKEDSSKDDNKLAYIIATTMHETGSTFHAIHEGLGKSGPKNDYWPSYANTGYWGRGFVQLTHETNYSKMENVDGINYDLSENTTAALLPTMSSKATAHGMLSSKRGETFTGKNLGDYMKPTDTAPNFTKARKTVNGTDKAAAIATKAETVIKHIKAYRAGVKDKSITNTLAEYLYSQKFFDVTKPADAIRILHALGNLKEHQAPGFNKPTDQKKEYQQDLKKTGDYRYLAKVNNKSETNALIAFQKKFNQDHKLRTPLNEKGALDEATQKALMLGGNRIAAGNKMIDYAFGGTLKPRNLTDEALEAYKDKKRTLPQLAQDIINQMPSNSVHDVLNIFNCLDAKDKLQLSLTLVKLAPLHDDLAIFNKEVLERMKVELEKSPNVVKGACVEHPDSYAYERIESVLTYVAPQIEQAKKDENSAQTDGVYVVKSGDSLSAIAKKYKTTVDKLVELNGLKNANSIRVGQKITLPK